VGETETSDLDQPLVEVDKDARAGLIAGAVLLSLSYLGSTLYALSSSSTTQELVGTIPLFGAISQAVHDPAGRATPLLVLSAQTQFMGIVMIAVTSAYLYRPVSPQRTSFGVSATPSSAGFSLTTHF
jgi:hypothetical protein